MRAFVLRGRERNSGWNLKGYGLVSHKNELSDLDVEILVHLHLRHLAEKSKPRRFASRTELLTCLKASPILKEDKDLTVSSYLRTVRTGHELAARDVAAVLAVPINRLKTLESSIAMPWDQSPSLMADLACLFRLHIQAIEALTRNSYDLARLSGELQGNDLASAQMSTWLLEVRSELQRRQANDLLT